MKHKPRINAEIKAVIFDMDGVLVDAKEWHYEALNQALLYFSFSPISRYDHINLYDGLPTKEKLKLHTQTKNLSSDRIKEINKKKQEYTAKIIAVKCKPNLLHQKTIKKLKKEGYKLAVCSNAIRDSVKSMLTKASIIHDMDFFLSNQDVVRAKPDSEIYIKAINNMGLEPDEVLICEDNINGIKAALGSGGKVLEISSIEDVTYVNIKKAIDKFEKGYVDCICRPSIRVSRLSEMKGGWFIGDFSPNILKTQNLEVGVKYYNKGDSEPWHVHKVATEITVILKGKAKMSKRILNEGDIMLLEPNNGTSFEALTDLITVVVKMPSIMGDKYYK